MPPLDKYGESAGKVPYENAGKAHDCPPRPISRAEEKAGHWAAAHNFRVRCEIDLQEATARLQAATSQEQSSWEDLEVAAGRRPETAQACEMAPQLRSGSIGQGGVIGRAY